MNKRLIPVIVLALLLGKNQSVSAQYPSISSDVQRSADSLLNAERARSDAAWNIAKPIIEEEARHGKPYIPWAQRPIDLPQAPIPAFPGAEGGGMYSYGGRGGRVIVVTSTEDRGPGTLREACEQGGARIIVFNVAGIIHLTTPLIIR